MDKMKYSKPSLKVVEMLSDTDILDNSMMISISKETNESWTKEDKGVWDKVWDRDPVFDADKDKN